MEKLYIKFEVRGQEIKRVDSYPLYSKSRNFVCAKFLFDKHWANVTRFASIANSETTYTVEIVNGECLVPWECLDSVGTFTVSVFGGDLITANRVTITVLESGLAEGEFPSEPTPNYFQITVDAVQALATAAAESATDADKSADAAALSEAAALISEQNAKTSEDNAKGSAEAAKLSETNADESAITASQALSDTLNVIGTSVAPLVGGKVPLSYMEAEALHDLFPIANESELTGLTAQKGDVAYLVANINDEPTIVKSWQLLYNDATVRSNWIVCGTHYAVQAGNATLADHAGNSERINGSRIVPMTQTQYEIAEAAGTIIATDIYFVDPDQEEQ